MAKVKVYLTAADANRQLYPEVERVSSPYPTTIVLTSLPDGLAIRCGGDYAIDSEIIQSLVTRVEHILLGVFDERSMMVWSRS